MARYETASDTVVDGAVFSFAKGTNPEVLLVIEAHRNVDGEVRFVYAPTRMTSAACELSMSNTKVWSVERDPGHEVSGTYRNLYTR